MQETCFKPRCNEHQYLLRSCGLSGLQQVGLKNKRLRKLQAAFVRLKRVRPPALATTAFACFLFSVLAAAATSDTEPESAQGRLKCRIPDEPLSLATTSISRLPSSDCHSTMSPLCSRITSLPPIWFTSQTGRQPGCRRSCRVTVKAFHWPSRICTISMW